MMKKKTKKTAESKPARLAVYTGHRPFRMDAADKPVMPSGFITEDHPYAKHVEHLLKRVDFEEISNG